VTRAILTVAVPLLLPLLIYAVWILMRRRFFPGAADGSGARTWSWVFLSGTLLAVMTLLVLGLEEEDAPAGRYVPATMKDGRIVPGHNAPP
jgi:hypothetical protein